MNKINVRSDLIWAYLIHLGYNAWYESDAPYRGKYSHASDKIRCDKETWDELLENMAQVGVNTVVIDLNEAVRYESHPEIAAEGAWSTDLLRDEINKMRKMGLNPIPKLNFSTCHDIWLGEYSRCVSTELYYKVCSDLINEVIDIFDRPDFFHIGMDEENYSNQQYYNYIVIRNGDLWWHDFKFLVDTVEKRGVRAWIWGDRARSRSEEFIRKMPKSVLISDWYYLFLGYDEDEPQVKARLDSFRFLSENGFEQVPGGSNFTRSNNMEALTDFCLKNLSQKSFRGMFQTVWYPTIKECKYRHLDALDCVRRSIKLAEDYYSAC
ncbi:MAG: Tat pathway signal protein [Clostridiales bacterium]|jgi:hypothetical protein|nr:Tat pathway signal protein [Clostridiales bacterium]